MFDWIRDILQAVGGHLRFWVVIDAYQNGGVLRFGKYSRTLAAGIHWKIPFVEVVNEQNVSLTTMRLPPQTLTTKDNVGVVAAAMVRYSIKDVEPYICGVTDQADVLIDVSMGAILKAITEATYEQLLAQLPEAKVTTAVRAKVNRYGFKIEEITFTDFAKVRSIRLIQPHAGNLAN